ncbi:hypothetical protein [Lactococcus garvieae]|uniref:hypothetical protein n=1 Tax=Lactococcus garvieae TaxID=1363 RepID=UPI0022E6DEBA|nr:hypothetical protein [Lactococcus garvieae]
MVRKNLWEILETKAIDIPQEYRSLQDLFHSRELARKGSFNYSFYEILEAEFLNLPRRGTCTTYDDFLEYVGLKNSHLNLFVGLDDLNLLIEVILFVLGDLDSIHTPFDYYRGREIVMDNISALLEKTNQKIISLQGKGEIVIPKDETITIAAELILPDDEKLAFEILGYSHYSNKDNIKEKRRILQMLANYLEPKLKKNKNSNISFLLNKYFIRHGDDENQKNVDSMTTDKLNMLYDKLYREILYYILEQEHKEFEVMVKDIKQNYGK